MTDAEQRRAARKFAEDWKDRGYEKGECQPFWMALLRNVFNVTEPEHFIIFENQVELGHTSFIDARIPATKILIEQKGLSVNLEAKQKQSDGAMLIPMEQAQRYVLGLKLSEHPRFIVVCNFATFQIYDTEARQTEVLRLTDLPKEHYRLKFLTDTGNAHLKREMDLSIQAGEIVGVLYDEILKHYKDPKAEQTLKSLNMLCVRLVFCLYAEDAGIFGAKNQFHDYLEQYDPKELRRALIDLFKVLDTKEEDRDPYLNEDLAAFPYVNGGLFADEAIEIPQLDETVKQLILAKASDDFDWSDISPTIFGAVFESTLNPETRRSGGMHYTSIENIHKVTDPLFLDSLKSELAEIKELKITGTRNKRLVTFQEKLAGLIFLDPACGSGNFLTETYLSLRKLENEVLELLNAGQKVFDFGDVIKVGIGQFYGIEINDFAVTVAKTALWIAESQMMKATEDIVHMDLDFLPLKSYANIVEGNALRLAWNTVVPKEKLNYIMGNPPFVGHQWRSRAQAEDMDIAFADFVTYGKLDYVAAWYKKAVDLMQGSSVCAAFVSTNSIVQGESVAAMWKPLFEQKNLEINFAWHTFRWDSEANSKAHVHCVIVGFSCFHTDQQKMLYLNDKMAVHACNINGYLLNAPNVFIQNRGSVLVDGLPKMSKGSQPTDGGNLILSAAEQDELLLHYPTAEPFIHQYISADDFINGKKRYCLWLKGVSPSEYRNIPPIMERLQKVAEMRKTSPTKSVQRDAETPMLFTQIRQPQTQYLVVPEVSSERRRYIPIGYLPLETIASNKLYIIPEASLYLFGMLTANVHMNWMRVVCGRLEMRYSYSPAVYNNFPWPEIAEADKVKIEVTAQGILDARAQYPCCSLADLYDETTMPQELRKAHQANDRAVMKAYGFAPSMTEPEIVAELMKRYQALTANIEQK